MSGRIWALAPYACWKCGSWGHFAENCPCYLTPEELAEKRAKLAAAVREEDA